MNDQPATTNTETHSGDTSPTGHRLLTVPEAAAQLRISRWMLYRLINSRQMSTITVGTRRLIPQVEIDRFIESRRNAEDQA